jgi:E3 ubiquitin-protein ligase HECTD2
MHEIVGTSSPSAAIQPPSEDSRSPGSANEEAAPIFKELENYVVAVFASRERVNVSFMTTGPPSESYKSPEKDSGNRRRRWAHLDKISNDFPDYGSDLVTLKSPRIDWTSVLEWYRLILHAGSEWRQSLDDLLLSMGSATGEDLPIPDLDEMERCITEAQSHAHRVLLKATESLLKRPGAVLREPRDIRFLMIIMANPLLYPADLSTDSITVAPNLQTPSRHVSRSATHEQLKTQPSKGSSVSGTDHERGPGHHSGIIKRLLGLIANLPNECHHHLVSWFSGLSVGHFEKVVNLAGSFVTYRLSRQQGKHKTTKQDPIANLVPELSATGPGYSAALHAALGVSGASKGQGGKTAQSLIYSDDWQLRAASRVMALLFAANNVGHQRHDRHRGRKQILATSAFYNTFLDYFDLVADFDAWEAKRGKFAFCQYPFFLSIWAKIQIMEYDARRQMEIKAREAFFESIMTRKAAIQYLILRVRRDCLVEDSLKRVSEVVGSGSEDIKKGLRIEFKGEEGIDAGGLRKEWFLLLVRDLFNPEHGTR